MKSPPDILHNKRALFVKHFATLVHPLRESLETLLSISDYACKQLPHLQTLLHEDDGQHRLQAEDYQTLVASISLDLPPTQFAKELRYFRHRHLLRLLLRELSGLANTEETMSAWSDCADALILHALRYCEKQLIPRFGLPFDEFGKPVKLLILAMGKLGGQELNLSSDIDLIFAYRAVGHTDGKDVMSNQQYFSKMIQQFIQLLQTMTVDGFVFRVDLRLRPNGDGGPLVCTLASMETYYQEQGRDWERYAMVKARPIHAFHDRQYSWFQRLITPFVYRRYVDFSVIESMRSIKAMIVREVQSNPMLDNIKHGRGGIREIEFIIQCFQLIRGGRIVSIQQQNAMAALHALEEEGLILHADVLKEAYVFLRRLENAIQMQNDQQTHSLPLDEVKQSQLLYALGYETWDQLLLQLHQYQHMVSQEFYAVLGKDDATQDEKRFLAHQLSHLWQGRLEDRRAISLLDSIGFEQPERCYQMIYTFRHSPRCRRLSQAARMRLDCFMVLLLSELADRKDTDLVLLQVLRLLENIVGRSAYLALLTENPPALQELLYWFANSPFITSLLVDHPFLFEILIDREKNWRPPSRRQLEESLQWQLSHCDDKELQDDVLRQFKLTQWLLAARSELNGQCDPIRIGRHLANVAEIIIAAVCDIACLRLGARYPEMSRVKSRFAIIAYGKLGSQEMNYDSDVDLVFLHTVTLAEEGLVTRLTQKILHMLTMRTQVGILYAVDTRLRPSGSAGLLVSHLDAFTEYQRLHAWTWEHQALVRARVLFANRSIRFNFHQLKKDILFLPRDRRGLRDDVQNMRLKIGKYIDNNAIKYAAGGLLDLEFLLQFLVLSNPNPGFVNKTNMLAQLQQLRVQGVLTSRQCRILKRAYRHYHRGLHQHVLQPQAFASETSQADVLAISQALFD